MADVNGPVIVKHSSTKSFVKPGLHSHNITRRRITPPRFGALRIFQILLLILGLCALGYYGYSLADQYIYQSYENWAFDQQIAGHSGVTFSDYLRQRTPFGFLVGSAPARSAMSTKTATPAVPEQVPARPAEGSLLGRVEIPRLNLSAIVREGVDNKTLSTAVGHIPSTALPGQAGNFAIAAHRDTLFRALKDIRRGDSVTFQSSGGTYTYEVVATKIVIPSDVSVLRSDGGGIIPPNDPPAQPSDTGHLLTMITCYPFYYVGSAPKRFIVEAELVSNNQPQIAPPLNDAPAPAVRPVATASKHKHIEPRHTRKPSTAKPKRPFWRRLLHVS
jgi:sortase A